MKFLLVAINAKYIHSNPGVYSLKAYGEKNCSIHVEIGEYTINNQMELILADVYKRKPDVVGISCYIWNITYALNLIHDLHKVLPDVDIWLGGPEVSFDAPKLLKREPEVLGVMKGEGEETFAGLLACYEKLGSSVRGGKGDADCYWNHLNQLQGVTYRDRNDIIVDGLVRPAMDMNKIPFLYPTLNGFEHRIVYYESSRGCPFSCSYCLSSIDKSVRFRDVELVKKELDFFLEQKIPQVKFVDRTFNCKKSHAMAIWKHILAQDNGITNFHFEIAADLLEKEELDLICQMRPGLIQLEIGVQSTNSQTLSEIRRTTDLDKLNKVVARINESHNVHQHLDLIIGLPFEGYESFRCSFRQVYAMNPDQLQLGFLKILKGSYMEEMTKEYGLIHGELPPYEVLSTRWISYGEILRLKGLENMVEVYYNSGQFSQTLALLEVYFPDSFSLFESLAEYYDRNQLTGQNHSRLTRYEILYRFIREYLPECEEMQVADVLMYDLYLRENAKSRPFFGRNQTVDKAEIRKRLPDIHTLGTQVHGELMYSGELLVFDYRQRDPLTNNAQVIKEVDYGKT